MKLIKIAAIGCPSDYQHGLLVAVLKSLAYHVEWVKPIAADLVIFGSFINPEKRKRWIPKIIRPYTLAAQEKIYDYFSLRKYKPITLFHTAENLRHNHLPADYSISFDLVVKDSHHYRLPYWMEMIDWSHEGITGNLNPRYGELLSIKKLTQPLGNNFLRRNNEAVIFSSHIREPRLSLIKSIESFIKLRKYGAIFDETIKNHHLSNFLKKDILLNFSYNLCPENGLYPGYVTEKIPEAFHSGCLPITWIDDNVRCDFNPNAFINLAPETWNNFEQIKKILSSVENLENFSDQALLESEPTISNFVFFLKKILENK